MQMLNPYAGDPAPGSVTREPLVFAFRRFRDVTPRSWVLHPFLLAVFPVLALFAQNAHEVKMAGLIRLLGVMLLGVGIVILATGLLMRDFRKGAVIASLAAISFYSLDTLNNWINSLLTSLSEYWVHTIVKLPVAAVAVPLFLLLGVVGYLLTTRLKDVRTATTFLNFFTAVLVVLPLGQIAMAKTPNIGRVPRVPVPFQVAAPVPGVHQPDIYYIILDGYARSDVMKSVFGFDNSPFLADLEKQGFYVARQSIANYCQTPLSLSGSLNAVYLDELVKGLGTDQTELGDLIGKNNVVATLKSRGYRFCTFATGFDPTEHPEADVYLSPHPFSNGFERMVVDMTPLRFLWPNPRNLEPTDMSRERTVYLLDHIADIARDPAPTFTFAHVFCPHPPLIYGPNGEDVRADYAFYFAADNGKVAGRFRAHDRFIKGYRGQAEFITKRIAQTITQILRKSPEPPIIILQSDHGSELRLDMSNVSNTDLKERMSILNAYYFPRHDYEHIYPGISPVNSFRVVLDDYFGAELPILPDRSFFSTWGEPYNFIDVTNIVQSPDALCAGARFPLRNSRREAVA